MISIKSPKRKTVKVGNLNKGDTCILATGRGIKSHLIVLDDFEKIAENNGVDNMLHSSRRTGATCFNLMTTEIVTLDLNEQVEPVEFQITVTEKGE